MKNQRQYRDTWTPGWQFVSNIDDCNAVFRAFGNSETFKYAELTKDVEKARHLSPVGLFYLFVEDEEVFEIFKKFSYNELIFTRMAGVTAEKNPHGVKIGKIDIVEAYMKHLNEEPKN